MRSSIQAHPGVAPAEKEPPVSPLLLKVRGWMELVQARNRTLEKPGPRDMSMVVGALLFSLPTLLFLLPDAYFHFRYEFAREPLRNKVLLGLLAPVVLIAALFYVVFYLLIGGLLRRMWVRRKTLRAADRAMKRLMREVGV